MSAMIDPLLERQRRLVDGDGDDDGDGDGASDHPDGLVAEAAPASPRRRGRVRVLLGRIALGAAVLLVPVLYSYTIALTGPGSDSLQARTVEWARDNHLGPLIDRLEKSYFSNHQAAVGGRPSLSELPELAGGNGTAEIAPSSATTTVAATVTATTGLAATGTALPTTQPGATVAVAVTSITGIDPTATTVAATTATVAPGPPTPLVSPAATPIAGEGAWTPLGPLVNGEAGAYVTAIRPDDVHTSSLDAVVNFDPKYFSFRAYPGTKIPKPWDRPDYVESERLPSLVAAFSGGFRLHDSGGGMILGGVTIQPMKNGIATMEINNNGVPTIGMWGRDIFDSSAVDSARQNLPLIVDNSTPNPDLATDANIKWGFTGPANKSAVWRSGAGITADGHLVWVGGPGLTIEALAETLIRAGAIRGMQLEINQEWVQFNTYVTDANGYTRGAKLLAAMQHTGNRWLTEDTRDFVAAFVRS